MDSKLLFQDEYRISLALSNIKVFQGKIQKIADEFNGLNLDTPVTRDFLYHLINSPRETVRGIYKSRLPSVDLATGLKVHVDQQLNNLVMPDLRTLVELCADIKVDSTMVGEFMPLLNVADEVELNESKIEEYLNRYRVFSSDPAVLKLFNQLSQVATILTAVNASATFTTSQNSLLQFDLGTLFKFNTEKEIVLSADGFKQLTYKLS
jgi:hypothetical protein